MADEAVETLVDRVLAALEEFEYAAEYRTFNVWGPKLARYRAVGGEPGFVKRTYDERIGWLSASKPREELREELGRRLSSATSRARNRSHDHYVDATDEFVVATAGELRDD